jgi:hypothetical protein
MTALNHIAHLADPSLARAAFGRLQAEPRTSGALLRRPIAVGAIRWRVWQAPRFHERHALRCQWRLDHKRCQSPSV